MWRARHEKTGEAPGFFMMQTPHVRISHKTQRSDPGQTCGRRHGKAAQQRQEGFVSNAYDAGVGAAATGGALGSSCGASVCQPRVNSSTAKPATEPTGTC